MHHTSSVAQNIRHNINQATATPSQLQHGGAGRPVPQSSVNMNIGSLPHSSMKQQSSHHVTNIPASAIHNGPILSSNQQINHYLPPPPPPPPHHDGKRPNHYNQQPRNNGQIQHQMLNRNRSHIVVSTSTPATIVLQPQSQQSIQKTYLQHGKQHQQQQQPPPQQQNMVYHKGTVKILQKSSVQSQQQSAAYSIVTASTHSAPHQQQQQHQQASKHSDSQKNLTQGSAQLLHPRQNSQKQQEHKQQPMISNNISVVHHQQYHTLPPPPPPPPPQSSINQSSQPVTFHRNVNSSSSSSSLQQRYAFYPQEAGKRNSVLPKIILQKPKSSLSIQQQQHPPQITILQKNSSGHPQQQQVSNSNSSTYSIQSTVSSPNHQQQNLVQISSHQNQTIVSNNDNGDNSSSVNNNLQNHQDQSNTIESNGNQQVAQNTFHATKTNSSGLETKNSTSLQQENQQTDEQQQIISVEDPHEALTSTVNTKEKTPMCLVNELARFNKIQHQYRLTGEQGPAHSKRFTVTLRLGDEEYIANGASIKKAQHAAAANAICETKYPHPPAKSSRLRNARLNGHITPTVELNALAMKLGKPTLYLFESQSSTDSTQQTADQSECELNTTASVSNADEINGTILVNNNNKNSNTKNTSENGKTEIATLKQNIPQYNTIPVFNHHGGAGAGYIQDVHYSNQVRSYEIHQRNYINVYQPPPLRLRRKIEGTVGSFFNRYPRNHAYNNEVLQRETCKITLMIGKQKFVGVGDTLQAAKHDAAARALEVLRPLAQETEETNKVQTVITYDDQSPDLKSPISLVHETALKRNLQVTFEVKLEKGPPHMKIFVTVCRVGNIVTEGEGKGKKISKKRAAEKMLEELQKLPPLSPQRKNCNENSNRANNLRRRPPILMKKKTKNIIKDNSSNEKENIDVVNPISKLIQIQQALKEPEPTYTLVEEKGAPRRREFIIEASIRDLKARGSGSNKKLAKKEAAKNLLALKRHNNSNESNSKDESNNLTVKNDSSKSNETTISNKSSVLSMSTTTNNSSNQGGSAGRQIVPGLLLMQPKANGPEKNLNKKQLTNATESSSSPFKTSITTDYNTTEANENNSSKTTQIINNSSATKTATVNINNNYNSNNQINNFHCDGVRPKDQLLYLADLLGFQVVFSDYPKGNHGEYLTIVTLTTDPPQICHGAGSNTDASQDKAAMTALQILSNLGLDNVKSKRPQVTEHNDLEANNSIVSG